MRSLSPEFELAAACCRWPPSAERKAQVATAARRVDWAAFAAVVKRHRVDALVWQALREADLDPPEPVKTRLHDAATQVATQNLHIAAESLRLQQSFADAGIELLFLKGLTLAVLAYGTPSLKMGSDIDILVPAERIEEGASLLRQLRYTLLIPDSRVPPGSLSLWHRAWKESVWQSPGGLIVELHSALVDNQLLLEGVGIDSPRQEVEISPGRSLPTLADSELFAYLAVHGASSAWFRLKWLADFAAFVSGRGRDEVTALSEASQRLGAGRSADLALLLAMRLFDLDLDPPLAKRIGEDRVNRWLMHTALRLMTGRGGTRELHELRLGTLAIHVSQYLLRPGWSFKLAQARQQLTDPYGAVAGHGLTRRVASRVAALARAGRLIR